MTIIAAIRRKKDAFIASDSLMTASGYEIRGGQKYRKIGACHLGIAGDVTEWPTDSSINSLHAALISMTSKGDDCIALMVDPYCQIWMFDNGEKIEIFDQFVAIGTGAACAMGAMAVMNHKIQPTSYLKAIDIISESITCAANVAESCGGDVHVQRIVNIGAV